MDKLFDLEGRVVVITGGLGQLGRQFTDALVQRGAKVAVLDKIADEDIQDNLVTLQVDVTDRSSIEDACSKVKALWGVPNGLINNAALDSPPGASVEENGPFEDYPADSWDQVMSVNTKGVFLCCQVVGGEMAKMGRGSIVNVASIYGMVSPDQSLYEYRRRSGEEFYKPVAYSASKSALYNLTRYMAAYWGKKNVRVNTVSFGGVFNDQDQEFLTGYNAKVPLGRMADQSEYNGAIVFLMSEASSYMTGTNLVLDGGFTAL